MTGRPRRGREVSYGRPAPGIRIGAGIVIALVGGACGGGRTQRAAPPVAAPSPPRSSPIEAAPDPPPAGRLGGAVLPRRAALDLTVDPRSPRFRGRVAIDLELTEPVSAIWLHGRDLTIERARLEVGARRLDLRQLDSSGPAHDLIGLALGQRIDPGPARLVIEYGGKLGSMKGLFRQEVDRVWYAFTDFEPTDARLAMPCFDDPRFKIPWQVTMRVPETMRAFANGPELRSAPAGTGWRRVEFAATPPLPSYLVAFAVGPFDVLDGAATPVPMRVVATRGRARLGREALAVAPGMLAELERYLGGKTPFPKLDFLAVPKFNGAMENPGLITFHAPILLVETRTSATEPPTPAWLERRRLMAGVMAHELAHLWFGDLITMRWWDELWLNEGLATWMSDRLMAAANPGEAGRLLEVADKSTGLDIDRRGPSDAVRHTIVRPPDIDDQFSPLIYRKGGAILAMFEAYLGEERMEAGIRRYVADSTGGSVTTADLAAALSAGAGRDLGPALSSFLDQPGVPVVHAALDCSARGARPTVTLRQSPYEALGAAAAARSWHIPVCVAWEGGAAPACTLLAEERGALELPADRCPAWIHPNPGERGYYIYSLPPAQLRALAAAPGLTPREQAGLADDLDALLAGGLAPLDAALDATWSLARAQDPITAVRVSETLGVVARALVGPLERRAFAARVRKAYGRLAHQLGLAPRDGDGTLDAELRAAIVPLVGRQGDERVLQRDALRRLDEALDQPADSKARNPPGLDVVAQLAPLAGGQVLLDRLLRIASRGPAPPGLGGFREPQLVERVLGAVRAGRIEPPAALNLLADLVRDGATQDQALPVALAEYPALAARMAEAERPRTALVFAGACRADVRAEIEEVVRRAVARGAGPLPPVPAFVLTTIASCAAFREHYLAAAARYFR